jgi:hypothetical protein
MMRAQTNYALLEELVFYTTRGITIAAQAAARKRYPTNPNEKHTYPDTEFKSGYVFYPVL